MGFNNPEEYRPCTYTTAKTLFAYIYALKDKLLHYTSWLREPEVGMVYYLPLPDPNKDQHIVRKTITYEETIRG